MRSRYSVTSSRDVTRPSFIAACISGMVASTTLKCRRLGGALVPGLCVCPYEVVAAENSSSAKITSFIVADSISSNNESDNYLRCHQRNYLNAYNWICKLG